MLLLVHFSALRSNFVEKKKFTVTRNGLPWYQKSLLRYFDAISTFLQNFARFLRRSALNPHTGGAPGPPLVTPQTSKIDWKSFENLSKIYRKSIENLSSHPLHIGFHHFSKVGVSNSVAFWGFLIQIRNGMGVSISEGKWGFLIQYQEYPPKP